MGLDPLRYASSELVEAVDAMGGQAFLAAIDELVENNEEYTLEWFDARWDDLSADEMIDWSIVQLARTGPSIAHAALEVELRTYPVDEENGDVVFGGLTSVTAFVRVAFGSEIRADRYELDFRSLGDWIAHDAIRFVDAPD